MWFHPSVSMCLGFTPARRPSRQVGLAAGTVVRAPLLPRAPDALLVSALLQTHAETLHWEVFGHFL